MQNKFLVVFVSALAYFLFGKFGLQLAIPPGFASAVWPASGVALALILLYSKWFVAVGILIGSFSINLAVSSNDYAQINLINVSLAMTIAIGATVQAVIGRLLFVKFIGQNSLIDSPKEIIQFLSFVAPVSCLIASVIGVSALHFFGFIGIENFVFSWFTWWAGDTIGVLLFTPMMLTLFSDRKDLSPSRKWYTTIPTIFIFLGVLVLFFLSTQNRQQQLNNEVFEHSQRIFYASQEKFKQARQILHSYSGFYRSSDKVTYEEFLEFSESILSDDKTYQAIEWVEIVPRSKKAQYEQEIRALGFSDFTISEPDITGEIVSVGNREEYYPVLYIYPYESNQLVHGLDLGFKQDRLLALKSAFSSNQPVATQPLRLVQEKENSLSTIVFNPIFRRTTMQSETPEFLGFIVGVIRIDGLLEDTFKQVEKYNIGVDIFDNSIKDKQVYFSKSPFERLERFSVESKKLEFFGRSLEIQVFATKDFHVSSKDWTSFIILTIGFLIASMLQAFILALTGRTEQVKQEVTRKTRDLSKAKQVAEAANKAKSEFTANISHEIRTPLNAIIGLLNQALKTPLSKEQKGLLKNTRLASETLMSLINSVLDFSKIEAGQLELEILAFDLDKLLNKIYAIFSNKAQQKELNFHINSIGELPHKVIGDQLRLEQVLLNLCGNAFKFTEHGKVELIVTTKEIKTEETTLNENSVQKVMICFCVRDTGLGINKDQIEKLFESFHQADASTNRKFGGTGLGLTISRTLVELMGGKIDCNSAPGNGSEFFFEILFELPDNTRRISENELLASFQSVEVDSIEGATEATEKRLSGKHILVVEDIELNQIVAEAILDEYGAKVRLAGNGIEALEFLEKYPNVDLILMDLQMPEMDGFEATQNILSQPLLQNIPILAMTANAMNEDVELCLKKGMKGHIAKPIDEKILITTILQNL